MVRFITFVIISLLAIICCVMFLSILVYDRNRQTNEFIRDGGVEFFKMRLKLFAIPTDEKGMKEYDKIGFLTWLDIKNDMAEKYWKIMEGMELKNLRMELITIGCYFTAFCLLALYSPALWAAEYRFGNEWEKLIFHIVLAILMQGGGLVRLFNYVIKTKGDYGRMSEFARKVIVKRSGIKMPTSIHFCYYHYSVPKKQNDSQRLPNYDWHKLSPPAHHELNRIAIASGICHVEVVEIMVLVLIIAAVFIHFVLFRMTYRLSYTEDELLNEMERIEDVPLDHEDDDDELPDVIMKEIVPDRNPTNPFYTAEVYNEDFEGATEDVMESMVETLLDDAQLAELRNAYLANYRQKQILSKSKKKKK